MSSPVPVERVTQNRLIALFQELGYEYAGDWSDRPDNRNIETALLSSWLASRGVAPNLASRAIRELEKAANDSGADLYDRNKAVYGLLRYGVPVKPDVGQNAETVWLIDWKHPEKNRFLLAEEVTVKGADAKASTKRPDLVLYVNGIALGVLELKRSSVSVSEGIRQNLDNQKKEFIRPFFATMQFVMAGSDTQGLSYGTILTPEKHYLTWREPGDESPVRPLDSAVRHLCAKARFLELIHDFVVFDAGVKKLCRHNQYFGVKASADHVRRRQGGILWHTQGSGKSLTMVWLAKWIRENVTGSRVLIITDRTELDEQIEKVFTGVNESIYRTTSGADLIDKLNRPEPSLLCSLIHKFGGKDDDESADPDVAGYVSELRRSLPKGFAAKGDLYVFVDECHRTQSGDLHKEMKKLLPNALFIGFTGTPLLRTDKATSIETFGPYIHTYRFNEAVRDKVVLDLRYEARDIDQNLTSEKKIDEWFELKTKGLTDLAKAQLKQRWGTLSKVLSGKSRLGMIVGDILMDMEKRDRLRSGHGNAMLVTSSIHQACKVYELLRDTELKDKCAIVTSYKPSANDLKGEESGEGLTERLLQYNAYVKMLAEWFNESEETAKNKTEQFEKEVKARFIKEPGRMKLLIVVDKLLTGFDAPPATYLYIDKPMQDHGLFQAICRVNRLDGDDKTYGYIIDYRDLFNCIKDAVSDYTKGALGGYDQADVAGLLTERTASCRQRLDDELEAMRALCEPVKPPKALEQYKVYFSAIDNRDTAALKATESLRLEFYKRTAALIRAYADCAEIMSEAGYSDAESAAIKAEIDGYEQLRNALKIHSGDAIDLKRYEPAMRHLIDTYIHADASEKISDLDDMSLVQLIAAKGINTAVDRLPDSIKKDHGSVAETVENNVRKLIIDESPINPKYYERMSELLDALIEQRKKDAIAYADYLKQIEKLTDDALHGPAKSDYPPAINSGARQALYDNLGRDEALAIAIDAAVLRARKDDWRNNKVKLREVRLAILEALEAHRSAGTAPAPDGVHDDAAQAAIIAEVERILDLAKNRHEY